MYGDSLKHCLVAVVVPDPVNYKAFADEKGLPEAEVGNAYKEAILQEMEVKVKEYGLTSLEKIKAIHLSMEPFSVDNNLITPTFKIKRNIAKVHFKEAIDRMYA